MIPLAEGLSVLESVVEVEKSVASGADKEEFPDQYFTDSPIKGGTGIKEQSKDWFVVGMKRMVDNFREEEGPHLMAHPGAEELDIGFGVVPIIYREILDVGIEALSNEGTRTDRTIARCKIFILLVPFE